MVHTIRSSTTARKSDQFCSRHLIRVILVIFYKSITVIAKRFPSGFVLPEQTNTKSLSLLLSFYSLLCFSEKIERNENKTLSKTVLRARTGRGLSMKY